MSFLEGEVFYRLFPDRLESYETDLSMNATELAAKRRVLDESAWRKLLTTFLRSCPQLSAFDRKDVVVDLSSPWPICVKSTLQCSRNRDRWSMHVDSRLHNNQEALAVINEMVVDVRIRTHLNQEWAMATWNDSSETNHVIRVSAHRLRLFGNDPACLMAMMLALLVNQRQPRGFILIKS
jgi:hypothetical protein